MSGIVIVVNTSRYIMFNMHLFGGPSQEHVNYIHDFIAAFQSPYTVGVSKAGEGTANKEEDFAQMRSLMSLVVNDNASLQHIACYTNTGAPITVDGPAADYYIGANKLNACPLIFMRKQETGKIKYLMWHLDFDTLVNPQHENTEIKSFLPKFFVEVADTYPQLSMRDMFTDSNTEILVTDQRLLSQQKFHCGAQASLFKLPNDLRIVSQGLDSSIRSYSIAYFPLNDVMLLCGHDAASNTPHFWAMKAPFSGESAWLKLKPCAEMVALAKSESTQRDNNTEVVLSDLVLKIADELHPEQRPETAASVIPKS
jgi:hypothetical protein